MMATMTAKLRELRELASKTAEGLKAANADVREDMSAQTAELAELQEHLAAMNTELTLLSAKHGALDNVLSRWKLHHATGAFMSDDRK